MKRDPFDNRSLGKPPCGGSWKYIAEKGNVLSDPNIWKLAKRIMDYRKANKFANAVMDYEQIQLEVCIANRVRCGLQVSTKLTPEMLAAGVPSAVQQYVKNRPGCRSCGRRGK